MRNRTRRTLEEVFSHPLPRNLRWTDLLAMAADLGVDVQDRGSRAVFIFKGRTASCHKPHGKATEKGAVAAVRDLLKAGGVTPTTVEED